MSDDNHDQRLMLNAAGEIEMLRKQNRELGQYRLHTERLLALFEGGPRQDSQAMAVGDDVMWRLRQRAEELGRNDPDTKDRDRGGEPVTTHRQRDHGRVRVGEPLPPLNPDYQEGIG